MPPLPTEKKLPVAANVKIGFFFFKNISRLRVPMSFLIADSESTQKVGSIQSFLPSWHFFGGSYPPILFFPQKQDLAVREQQNLVCDQPTTDSKNSGSKAYTLKRNLVFFLKRCAPHPLRTPDVRSVTSGGKGVSREWTSPTATQRSALKVGRKDTKKKRSSRTRCVAPGWCLEYGYKKAVALIVVGLKHLRCLLNAVAHQEDGGSHQSASVDPAVGEKEHQTLGASNSVDCTLL